MKFHAYQKRAPRQSGEYRKQSEIASDYEGDTLFSNTPYVRPLLTVINDTVDYEEMYREVGPTAAHSYVYNSGRCNVGLLEAVMGCVNQNNCDSNMLKGIYEVAGEEVARAHKIPQALMYFQ